MENILAQITAEYSTIFYVRQVLTILVLFACGYFACIMLLPESLKTCGNGSETLNTGFSLYPFLLAFPVGISIFSLCGLLILISGIKYCAVSVVICVVAVYIIMVVASRNKLHKSISNMQQYIKFHQMPDKTNNVLYNVFKSKYSKMIYIIMAVAAVVAIALLSVSGIISTSFSNDSMYYYSEYPRAIVARGALYYGFDVNLTDAGQTTVVLNTLPYLFGFDETFGIHAFFNINFILFFAYVIYEQAAVRFDKKKSLAFSILFTLLLVTSMPFVLISKWNIANVYFMEQMFICMYLFFRADEAAGQSNSEETDKVSVDITLISALLLSMLAFMRIEGAVYVVLLLACALTLKNVKKQMILIPAAAVFVLQALYFAKIFIFMELLASYSFMTKGKAIIILVLFVVFMTYVLLFADSGKIIYNKLNNEIVYIAVLVLANIAVFAYDRAAYVENIKSIITNMRENGGWGFFPAVVIALIILVPKVKIKTLYFDMFFVCFALVSLIACALRGGTLRVSFADSGNRVFLQIVPFVIYAFAYRYIESFKITEESKN